MPYMADWENTHHVNPAVRVMLTRHIKQSEETLDMICDGVYWATIFMKNIKILECEGMLYMMWRRSIRGLTIVFVWSQISSQEIAALHKIEDQVWEEATYVTTANRLSQ